MRGDEKADGEVGGVAPRRMAGRRLNKLGHQAQSRLGVHLRTLYEPIKQQPIPDRFKELIARLDSTEANPHAADD